MKATFIAERVALALIPVLALAAPVLERLAALNIPLQSKGGLLILGGACLVGLALGVLAAISRSFRGVIGRILPALFLATAVIIAADVGLGGLSIFQSVTGHTIEEVTPESWGPVDLAVLAIAALALLFALLEKVVPRALGAFVIVMLATTVIKHLPAGQASASQGAASDKPATIFIVLDEMMGLAGLYENALPEAGVVAGILEDVLERHGFRVYPNAYSRHFFSDTSIPAMLNFDTQYIGLPPIGTVKEYRLFEEAAAEQVPVSVYQTQHINFCTSPAVSECETYPSFNPYNIYSDGTLPERVLIGTILRNVENSIVFMMLRNAYINAQETITLPDRFELHGFQHWMKHIGDEILEDGRGRISFIHVLAPHAPYLLGRDCGLHDKWTFGYYLAETQDLAGDALEEQRVEAYRGYLAQTVCVANTLDALVDQILSDPDFADAKIVVTGDHGSRISAGQYLESLQRRDFVDNFSTLFAVRAPHVEPRLDPHFISVQALAQHHLGGLPLSEDDEHTVAIQRKDESWTTAPMPVLSAPSS